MTKSRSVFDGKARGHRTSALFIGQDNLLADLSSCATDYIPTGKSITPMAEGPQFDLRHFIRIVSRLARGQYDLIVLPAIDFDHEDDASRAKNAFRRIIAGLLRWRAVSHLLDMLLSRRGTRLIMLDRYDSCAPLTEFLKCFPSTQIYFKTNLLGADNERIVALSGGRVCRLKSLPYWVATDKYLGEVSTVCDKDIDVFFAGTLNSAARRASIEQLKSLSSAGYRIKIFDSRALSFNEYLTVMARSWLTLSPEGYGYNGFRHFESMLVGSLPLINRPQANIVNDFVHGENCFLYSVERCDLPRVIREALEDKDELLRLAKNVRRHVVERHSPSGVGHYLLQSAMGPSDLG